MPDTLGVTSLTPGAWPRSFGAALAVAAVDRALARNRGDRRLCAAVRQVAA